MALIDEIRSNFPWLVELGLDTFVIDQIRGGATIEETIAGVRQTPQYQARFPSMLRDDGSRRFATEAEYLQAEDDYRQILLDFGFYDPAQDGPLTFAEFMEKGIQPDELGRRFEVYRALERGSQEIRDAFYVYAGLQVSVDDLYEAVTDHRRLDDLVSTYDQALAMSTPSYEQFITRVTELGIQHLTQQGQALTQSGFLSQGGLQSILNSDPNQARELIGALYSSSFVSEGSTVSLDELLAAFEYAMIGSAASAEGFTLPDQARIQEMLSAGVDRARALRGYSQAALRASGLGSMAARFNRGSLDQELLEDAFVLGEAQAANQVTRLYSQESALGQAGAGFSKDVEEGRIVTQGRTRR